MKGFFGVTDNDWFAYVTLLKLVGPKAQGLRHKAIESDWATGEHVGLGTALDLWKLALKTPSGHVKYKKS